MMNETEFYREIAESAVDALLETYYRAGYTLGLDDYGADDMAEEKLLDKVEVLSTESLDAFLHGEDAYEIYRDEESEVR